MSVLDQALGGHPDDRLATVCQKEQRAIITFDLDFSDIRTYPPEEYFGIVVLRLGRQEKSHVLKVLEQLIPKFDDEPLASTHSLWSAEHRVAFQADDQSTFVASLLS